MVCFMVVAVVVADESEAKNVNKVSHLCCVLKSFKLQRYDFPETFPTLWLRIFGCPTPPLRTLMCCFNLF